jgi:hypothetical protein
MAQLSLGENRWRMLRRVVRKKRFTFDDARNMTRQDQGHFDWFVANGFVAPDGVGTYRLTDRGRVAAELGLYEWEPATARLANPRAWGRAGG